MAALVVDLQDGFTDDLVVIRVNGKEVFRKENVKTRLLLGLADSIEIQVPEGSVNVELVLPLRNLSETVTLQVPGAAYLGLSLDEGRIKYRVSSSPFGYM